MDLIFEIIKRVLGLEILRPELPPGDPNDPYDP
jgi:hypothetical protein